ncbi:hypothetical protein [Haloarchaeobius sp. HME9146]|uniref:hypothetical protein n=1 Tax=Haloarchaeobius sp. HME9146 TaxID=2978732 RepID=UPI0021C21122|nr:hypothetical protein [Haloarchaeobius sp. HME9146]MCT9097364.1 hypothetical protein [Haloarchaeobius sp. HME9146]
MGVIRIFRLLSGLVTFTLVEVVTLGLWLALVLEEPLLVDLLPAGAPDAAILAGIVLVVGLFLEGFVNDITANGIRLRIPVVKIGLFSITEAVIWVVWLRIAQTVGGLRGIALAGVFLAVIFVPQHTVEDNVLRGEAILSRLIALGTVSFSVVEAVGATVWLVFVLEPALVVSKIPAAVQASLPSLVLDNLGVVGLAVLAGFLLLEHTIALRFGLRGTPNTQTVRQAVLESLESTSD